MVPSLWLPTMVVFCTFHWERNRDPSCSTAQHWCGWHCSKFTFGLSGEAFPHTFSKTRDCFALMHKHFRDTDDTEFAQNGKQHKRNPQFIGLPITRVSNVLCLNVNAGDLKGLDPDALPQQDTIRLHSLGLLQCSLDVFECIVWWQHM